MKSSTSKRGDFLLEVSQSIAQLLHKSDDLVVFSDSVEFNAGPMLGAALDYENILSARLGSSSFLVLHLIGHGVLLDFNRDRGWNMLSSFPFPVTLIRESNGGDIQVEGEKYLTDAYTDLNNSFATSFISAAKRLAPTWRDGGHGFNIRIMSSQFHPTVKSKLAEWKLDSNLNESWFGNLASAAVCEALSVPVVPYVENQALGRFTYKFSDRLTAQNVRLPDENDIDIRLHVTLRNVAREVKYHNQYQRWEVNRMAVFEVTALDDRGTEVLSMRFGYQDPQPDTLAREEDLVPARDVHFFDMTLYRGLHKFFSAINTINKAAFTQLLIDLDAEQQSRVERFRTIYRRAI